MGGWRRKIRNHLVLMRPINIAMVGAAVIVGEVVALHRLPGHLEALLGFFTGLFISASSMVLNDCFDVEVDRINEPGRPLPSGEVNLQAAFASALLWASLGLLSSIFLGPSNFIIASTFWVIAIVYNWRGKEAGLLGNLMVSTSVAIPYIYGGVAVEEGIDGVIIIFFLTSLLANMGREVAKGIVDLEGDRMKGLRTVATSHGIEAASKLSSLFLLAAIVFSWLPSILAWLGSVYTALILTADVAIAYPACKILLNGGREEARRVKDEMLVGMLLGLIAFLVGSVAS